MIVFQKFEGNAFLIRIPNAQTRLRVLNQRLWQVEGQTMFVANWEPGVIPAKPELTSAPIWLELRNVPLQFFNDDGLERIASLVGDPKFLHPSTANKSNLEVAKVFTIIDPRKPLPEAVNVQFDNGEIQRILVSSPWMPPICSHCKGVGHSLKRCLTAPVTCKSCNSTSHLAEKCPRIKGNGARKPSSVKGKAKPLEPASNPLPIQNPVETAQTVQKGMVSAVKSRPEGVNAQPSASQPATQRGDSSKAAGKKVLEEVSDREHSRVSEAEPDSSDTLSSEEGEIFEDDFVSEEEHEYLEVVSKRNRRNLRGSGSKLH